MLIDRQGSILAGKHPVESTAMYIHAAVHRICRKACVLHTHQPYSTALALTAAGQLDTTLSQNAMRFHGRVAVDGQYNGLALDAKEGERIARSMQLPAVAVAATAATAIDGSGVVPDSSAATTTTSSSDAQYADVGFLCNHGVIVCGERIDHAYDDLYYLERASMHQVLAQQVRRTTEDRACNVRWDGIGHGIWKSEISANLFSLLHSLLLPPSPPPLSLTRRACRCVPHLQKSRPESCSRRSVTEASRSCFSQR